MEVLIRQRRAMWENMGVENKYALDKADKVYRKWAREQLASGMMKAWLAQDRLGQVVAGGCLWLQPIQPQPGFETQLQPYLMSMFTEPEFRKKGAASKIVRAAVEWCKRNDYPWIVLHASPMGRTLYRGFGFKRSWEMDMALTSKGRSLVRHGVKSRAN